MMAFPESLRKEEYGKILCYPRYEAEELERRLNELKTLGVKALCFKGKKRIENIPILGKGCVGIVVAAYTEAGEVALKIRRTDVETSRIAHEAKMLQIANSVGVGPKILGFSENFIIMDLIEGDFLSEWVETLEEKEKSGSRLRRILKDILEQCRRLDIVGLDHGELSRASKHIIVNREDKAYIIDFETASVARRTSNVTSICQYLFLRGRTAERINAILGKIKQNELLAALKDYKRSRTTQDFEMLLKACHL